MSLEQHTSLDGALSLAPGYFFLDIGQGDEDDSDGELSVDRIEAIMQRTHHYLDRARDILDKPRTGWTREERNMPSHLCETVAAHMVKVGLASKKIPDGLIKWHMRRGELPSAELVKVYQDVNIRSRLVRK